ADKNFLRF
uniref:FMRFamide-like neuropeptide FLP2 n=1 Tax=Macrobrachium rosenbergii TaxID=79674 RepID=FAR2_MACRS|nr:RecName: Full=FMRFamide-like neuropeptide FLP2; AltName: Full=ADKNFLRF-amide [Macrobrachium rosenbergii]